MITSIQAIAAACGFIYSPPPIWDAMPTPANEVVVYEPYEKVARDCLAERGTVVFGCSDPLSPRSWVSTRETFPGADECWRETLRHESAHRKGWVHK